MISLEAFQEDYKKNHDKGQLKEILYPSEKILNSWLGNEVVCSIGEQRIDILSIVETSKRYYIRVIELKHTTPYGDIVNKQIIWYLKWVGQYMAPLMTDKEVVVVPTVIAAEFTKNSKRKREFFEACDNFNCSLISSVLRITVKPVEYISFNRTEENISFKKYIK